MEKKGRVSSYLVTSKKSFFLSVNQQESTIFQVILSEGAEILGDSSFASAAIRKEPLPHFMIFEICGRRQKEKSHHVLEGAPHSYILTESSSVDLFIPIDCTWHICLSALWNREAGICSHQEGAPGINTPNCCWLNSTGMQRAREPG